MSAFTPAGSGGAPVQATFSGATTPTVANVSMLLAATEYSYVIPDGTTEFLIRTRNGSSIQVAYVAGTTSTDYISVAPKNWYGESEKSLIGVVIYFQSPVASETAEIISWV